ncbi:MAG: hypothetical protein AAF561_09585 [Planctomycetota bacterium]
MHWRFDEVADAVSEVLQDAEANLKLEQAVYGLDAMKEVPLQALLAEGLDWHYGVAREQYYPSDFGKRSGRRRCDLVLTPSGRELWVVEDTDLFTPADVCPANEALWLEVKVAHQFAEGGRRHAGYGQQWRNKTVDDLRKMEAEPMIHEAGLLLIAFTGDEAIIDADLEQFEDVLARKEVLAGFRQVRGFDIVERNGHTRCTVALWPTVLKSTDS